MARYPRLDVLNEIVHVGIVPVFYHSDLEVAKRIVAACRAGGVRSIEFTNRGDNAYRVFSDLVLHFAKSDPSVILGVGSVIDPGTASLYLASGANFVVGPVLNFDVAKACNRRKVAYSPGCGSVSEVSQAEELGVEIVKVFPGDSVGGPQFVKSILGPMPWTRIMPTGGVEATKESVNAWFKAGVAAIGIGSNLIRKDLVEAGNYEAITNLASQMIAWVRETRGESVFRGVEHPGLYPYREVSGRQVAEWYSQVFGFKLKEGNSSFFLSGTGAGRIEVMKEGNTDRVHLAVEVTDFDLAVATLSAKGIGIEDLNVKPDSKSAYLKQTDPAGNRVHLLWRRDGH